jgi:hypothetical protein
MLTQRGGKSKLLDGGQRRTLKFERPKPTPDWVGVPGIASDPRVGSAAARGAVATAFREKQSRAGRRGADGCRNMAPAPYTMARRCGIG